MSTLLPALDILKKARIIPLTVPRKPIIGAPPAMLAKAGSPFSKREISWLPAASIAAFTSASERSSFSMPRLTVADRGVPTLSQ